MEVTISDKSKSLLALSDERDNLFLQSKELTKQQQKLYEEFFINMQKLSNKQEQLAIKIDAVTLSMKKIMESGV